MKPGLFFDISRGVAPDLFSPEAPVWSALSDIELWLAQQTDWTIHGSVHPGAHIGPRVHVAEGCVIEPGAVIQGPAWIERGTVIRSGCYLRPNVIVGEYCILGNSCEFKNCWLAGHCEIPHFNYVGDSLLGWKAHLGAGVILSNVRLDHGIVSVRTPDGKVSSGLKKFGAIIGDGAEIGCNSVINPGSLIGPGALIHPLVSWSGHLPAGHVARNSALPVIIEPRP
jgi:UDP-N-acetylglucosamine diphosphorylase / glucose-1-phosphate thymidylyltransferase / UDP-N-acetylgalactosamine diphosphorylase / glucosamine-1-phosphate N-acetyltransferase / galactosamine-1-phosphate N-acetyltransferase